MTPDKHSETRRRNRRAVMPGRTLIFLLCAILAQAASAAQVSYTYDPLNRLANVDYGNGSVISYTYDPAGNRLSYSGTVVVDTVAPTVTITAPANKAEFTSDNMTVTGSALDNVNIKRVLVKLNNGSFVEANVTNSKPTTAQWGLPLTLVTGTNVVTVKSVDLVGNESLPMNRSYFLRVPGILTLNQNGNGAVTTNNNLTDFYVGRRYGLTAVPDLAGGYLFSNWVNSGSVVTDDVRSGSPVVKKSVYAFEMASNLTLTVNFVTNRFGFAPDGSPVAGSYYGLFYDTIGVAHQSSGFITLKTTSKQKFSGKVLVDGNKVGFSGTLALDGTGTSALKPGKNNREKFGKTPVYVTVALDMGGSGQITGTVYDDPVTWTSDYVAYQAVYDKTLNQATNFADVATGKGQYTLVIPGVAAAGSPKGDSYAVVMVGLDGKAKASGGLAEGDGSKALKLKPLATSISKDGEWPFYAPAYLEARIVAGKTIKEYQGALLGWLAFTGDPYATNRDLTGTVVWMKPGWTNTFYTGGFTNAVEVAGSVYVMPAVGDRALDVPNDTATAVHTDGNLTANFENQFAWLAGLKTANKLTALSGYLNGEKSVAITAKSGKVKGTFLNGAVKTTEEGVLLQDANVGRGFFLGTSESGAMTLTPD